MDRELRRKLVKSAPSLSRLPRLDSTICRQELVTPSRRQATARLRRTFLERRQAEINAEDALLRQRQLMKDKKEQLDRACVLYDQRLVHNLPVQQERKDEIRNTALQKEVIKCNIPRSPCVHCPNSIGKRPTTRRSNCACVYGRSAIPDSTLVFAYTFHQSGQTFLHQQRMDIRRNLLATFQQIRTRTSP
ncbi:hypothetical protein DPMN_103367 [Dreissena polymorpha]|uniref:Uncharacterized protein n=1 Tax=Dreissena polymorpha TaxID=45954 RepID=A0A9D4HB08_DREPO|nr:hypothetical protein DPMN_103367 [Dreissena polymorpha]